MSHSAQRVGLLLHLPHVVDLVQGLSAGAIPECDQIKPVVSKLLECGVGVGDARETIHVVMFEFDSIATRIGERAYPIQSVMIESDGVGGAWQRPVHSLKLSVDSVG